MNKKFQMMSLTAFALIGLAGSECMADEKRNECYKGCIDKATTDYFTKECYFNAKVDRTYITCGKKFVNCTEVCDKDSSMEKTK